MARKCWVTEGGAGSLRVGWGGVTENEVTSAGVSRGH